MTRTRELRALLRLARAQLSGRSVQVRFRDTERSTVERTMDVLALAFEPPRWLAATWSPERGSLRLLDVARVLRVRGTRRRARPPPRGFDPVHFAVRTYLDGGASPPRWTTIRVEPPWSAVARALLPTCEVEPQRGGAALLRVRTSNPALLTEIAGLLSAHGALDSP